MREVVEKRTATSKTFDLGKGKFQTEYYGYPIHYPSEDGWVEINTEIVPIKSWEFTEGVVNGLFRTYFGDVTSDNQHLYGIEFKGADSEKWINFKLKGANPTSTKTEDNLFRFVECMDGVDVEYIVHPDSVKENIVLNKPTHEREFVFTVKSGGASLREDGEELSIVDTDTGSVLWAINKPYMVSADGKVSYGIRYDVSHDGYFDTLAVVVEDEDFLENASYPITIDPTVVVNQTNDEVILATFLTENSSSNPSGWTYNERTYFGGWHHGYQYNTSAIYFKSLESLKHDIDTAGAVISKATLEICIYRGSPYRNVQGFAVSNVSNVMDVGVVPVSVNDRFYVNTTQYAVGTWLTLDISQQLKEKGGNFNGLFFSAAGSYQGTGFYSPFASDVTKRPKLTVEYLVKPVIGFHDGSGQSGMYYSDGYNSIFKLLDFGTLVAGQTSAPQKVFVKNLAGFNVTNLRVYVEPFNFPEKVALELSLYNSPFIPESTLTFNGVVADEEEFPFYVRVVTQEDTMAGGDFDILAKADPY